MGGILGMCLKNWAEIISIGYLRLEYFVLMLMAIMLKISNQIIIFVYSATSTHQK